VIKTTRGLGQFLLFSGLLTSS